MPTSGFTTNGKVKIALFTASITWVKGTFG